MAPPSRPPRIAFLGASLLAGTISAPLPARVLARWGQPDAEVLNAGVNGDLAWNVLLRAPSVLAWQPDVVVVLVGTNDVLASLSPERARWYRRWKKLPQAADLPFFQQSLTALLDLLGGVPRVVLGTLPPLGEALDDDACVKVRRYNEFIVQAAQSRGWSIADLYAVVSQRLKPDGKALPKHDRLVASSIVQRRAMFRSDGAIARQHGFAALVDGIHLTEDSADAVADAMVSAIGDTARLNVWP